MFMARAETKALSEKTHSDGVSVRRKIYQTFVTQQTDDGRRKSTTGVQ